MYNFKFNFQTCHLTGPGKVSVNHLVTLSVSVLITRSKITGVRFIRNFVTGAEFCEKKKLTPEYF